MRSGLIKLLFLPSSPVEAAGVRDRSIVNGSVVGTGLRGDGRVSAKDDLDGKRLCPEGDIGAALTEKYPVSSSLGFRRREGAFRYVALSPRANSLTSGRFGYDIISVECMISQRSQRHIFNIIDYFNDRIQIAAVHQAIARADLVFRVKQ